MVAQAAGRGGRRRLGVLLRQVGGGPGRAVPAAAAEESSSSGTTTFYIVRHGETEWNRQGRQQGSVDAPLNAAGIAQAEAVAAVMADWPCDAVATSPLSRTASTAKAIHRHHPSVPYREYPGLAEANAGELERRLHSDPDVAAAMDRCNTMWRAGVRTFPYPRGESPALVIRREYSPQPPSRRSGWDITHPSGWTAGAKAALAEASSLGSNVIVSCHGMVLKCLAWATLECDWAQLEVTIPNCSVSTYEYDRRTGELTLLKLFEVVIEGEALDDVQANAGSGRH